jgi:hypothetical protein
VVGLLLWLRMLSVTLYEPRLPVSCCPLAYGAEAPVGYDPLLVLPILSTHSNKNGAMDLQHMVEERNKDASLLLLPMMQFPDRDPETGQGKKEQKEEIFSPDR